MNVAREALEELRAKYATMLAMRVADAAGGQDDRAVRAKMAELAARFPGALREIDDLELAEIRRRIEALDAVLGGGCERAAWMEAVALFHALARGALAAKRWLGRRKRVDGALLRRYAADHAGHPLSREALAWADDLPRLASPPRGRVMDLVFARLAQKLAVSEKEARVLVFGIPRRARKRRWS